MTLIGIILYFLIGGLIAGFVIENNYNMESTVVELILCLLLWPLWLVIGLGMNISREKRKD